MKVFKGRVVSAKMTKTATVVVERIVVHPVYKKRYKRAKKYHVHDELGAKVGDTVEFTASRPYSKLKKWEVIKVISETKNSSSGSGSTGVGASSRTRKKKSGSSLDISPNTRKREAKKS
jgi:small subunit ribosomal protein S17